MQPNSTSHQHHNKIQYYQHHEYRNIR